MAEIVRGHEFIPDFKTVVNNMVFAAAKKTSSQLGKEAYNEVMSAWDREKGYNSAGNQITWKRSEKSTRDNPLMYESGFLQSQLKVVETDRGADFKFQMAGGTYPDRGDRTSDQISGYLEEQGFPHLNVPKKYRFLESKYSNLYSKNFIMEFNNALKTGVIKKL